jgi:hypothetical protein
MIVCLVAVIEKIGAKQAKMDAIMKEVIADMSDWRK